MNMPETELTVKTDTAKTDLLAASQGVKLSVGNRVNNKVPVPKRPSKMFTEYYGSLVLALIAIAMLSGYVFIKPKLDGYKEIRALTETTLVDAQNEKRYLDALSRSVAAAQTISPDVLRKVDTALPRSIEIPEILVELDRLAADNGVKIKAVTLDAAARKPAGGAATTEGIQTVGMNISVEAKGYESVKDFLRVLETNLRIFDVQALNVASFDEESSAFTLQMKTYYYPARRAGSVSRAITESAVK